MIIEEVSDGIALDLNILETPILLPDTSTHKATVSGSFSKIELITSTTTSITPGDYFGAIVIPVELDVSNDAILSRIAGFTLSVGDFVISVPDLSGTGTNKEIKMEVSIGTTSEDYNSDTVTLLDALDWLQDPLKDYVEYFSHQLAVEKPTYEVSLGSLVLTATGFTNITPAKFSTVDLSLGNAGAIDAEVTGIVIYMKYGDNNFTSVNNATYSVGNSQFSIPGNASNLYFTEVIAP